MSYPHLDNTSPASGKNIPPDLLISESDALETGSSGLADPDQPVMRPNAVFEVGWGRILYGPSFESPKKLAEAIQEEAPGHRDIALQVNDPQLVLAEAQSNLFLDPSLIFRRPLDPTEKMEDPAPGLIIRPLTTRADIAAINRLYSMRNMVTLDTATVWAQRASDAVTYLIAEDERTGEVVGSVMGLDHAVAFGCPRRGSSFWCLVVDPQSSLARTGQSLVNQLIKQYASRGCAFLELSVLHTNALAIGLYKKLGFQQESGFVIKTKNAINEGLFADTSDIGALNPYARIIVDEARRRAISVEVIDAAAGIFKLRHAGHEILCRESLTELTGGVAMTWCQDKVLTSRRLNSIGLRVPKQWTAGDPAADNAFLKEHGSVVVKPALGEQGKGISIDVQTPEYLAEAIERARKEGGPVILEEFCSGQDLRIVVIGYKVVAAAIRRPAQIVGDGSSTVEKLIEAQSARRAAATGGESRIPVDAETERCLAGQGLTMQSVPESGQTVQVRKTANLHTGGTIHDVTAELHPVLRDAAETAARALRIPVVGLDFLVPSPDSDSYVIIEANERPGLANHDPQPTAQRFIDLLFPYTA
jgi:GNAT-family acetyltransferase (TIGR03103 family)